jgi:hypothetical protein
LQRRWLLAQLSAHSPDQSEQLLAAQLQVLLAVRLRTGQVLK